MGSHGSRSALEHKTPSLVWQLHWLLLAAERRYCLTYLMLRVAIWAVPCINSLLFVYPISTGVPSLKDLCQHHC